VYEFASALIETSPLALSLSKAWHVVEEAAEGQFELPWLVARLFTAFTTVLLQAVYTQALPWGYCAAMSGAGISNASHSTAVGLVSQMTLEEKCQLMQGVGYVSILIVPGYYTCVISSECHDWAYLRSTLMMQGRASAPLAALWSLPGFLRRTGGRPPPGHLRWRSHPPGLALERVPTPALWLRSSD